MLRTPILGLSMIAFLSLAGSAGAQLPLKADDASRITRLLDAPAADSLKCAIEEWKPMLDFAFRFETGYTVLCRLGIFDGKKATVVTYVRIIPNGKAPALFGSAYRVPEISPEMQGLAGKDPRRLKNELGMSGALGVGEGDYSVEVIVMDDRDRSCRKSWKLHVAPNRSQRDMEMAIPPLSVESLDRSAWPIATPQQRGGVRLTILLDAAPLNPYQSRLRAWDREFLLECIYSLLRQTPYKSVRLTAFNLEQQREIFRSDQFDSAAFIALSQSLREVETASVSVEALKKRNSPDFLSALANQELAATRTSDAVVFLGPNGRMDVKMKAELLTEKKENSPPFFYFEYFPWLRRQFPDAIQRLVKAAGGKTFQIHSPAEFDQAIQKMLTQLKQQ